jgi:hypothetical protein
MLSQVGIKLYPQGKRLSCFKNPFLIVPISNVLIFCSLIFNRELLTQNGAFAEFLIQYLQEQGEVEGKAAKLLNYTFINYKNLILQKFHRS